jgi:REP element-mobilizing transposase RayT
MPYPKAQFRAGECYYLYNQGVGCQPIFFDAENWGYFIARLKHYCQPDLIDVVAYCLMPTHYHLLVRLKTVDLATRIMRPLGLSYTMAINRQQGRAGSLFQGPFKAVWVNNNTYLLHLSRYIHMNPVTNGLATQPEEWEFSSYRDYVGLRQDTLPALDIILSQFPSPQAYRDFVEAYREYHVQLIEHLLFDEG